MGSIAVASCDQQGGPGDLFYPEPPPKVTSDEISNTEHGMIVFYQMR